MEAGTDRRTGCRQIRRLTAYAIQDAFSYADVLTPNSASVTRIGSYATGPIAISQATPGSSLQTGCYYLARTILSAYDGIGVSTAGTTSCATATYCTTCAAYSRFCTAASFGLSRVSRRIDSTPCQPTTDGYTATAIGQADTTPGCTTDPRLSISSSSSHYFGAVSGNTATLGRGSSRYVYEKRTLDPSGHCCLGEQEIS